MMKFQQQKLQNSNAGLHRTMEHMICDASKENDFETPFSPVVEVVYLK